MEKCKLLSIFIVRACGSCVFLSRCFILFPSVEILKYQGPLFLLLVYNQHLTMPSLLSAFSDLCVVFFFYFCRIHELVNLTFFSVSPSDFRCFIAQKHYMYIIMSQRIDLDAMVSLHLWLKGIYITTTPKNIQ